MTDILVRQSDGLVEAIGASIALMESGDRYLLTESNGSQCQLLTSSFGSPVSLVSGVSNIPNNLYPGLNYTYSSGTWTNNGNQVPTPVINIWARCKPKSVSGFVTTVVGIIGPAGWNRLQTDPASSFLLAAILGGNSVDPNDPQNVFQEQIAYLTTTNGANSALLMTPTQTAQIAGGWNLGPT